jgi:hypothetical protein
MASSLESGLIPARHVSSAEERGGGASSVGVGGVPPRTGGGTAQEDEDGEAVKGVEGFKEFKGFAPIWEQIL